jgi:eukaryotic-like serine/threonine-protein kinase
VTLPKLPRYEILAKIGEGGAGSVFKAGHRVSGELVAIKIIPLTVGSDAVTPKRLEQEFLTLSQLDHPGIVRALDFGQEGASCYLVMELVDGISLAQRIERHGRLPETLALSIIAAVAYALQAAHEQGLIHRDIKPNNVMLTRKGLVKLTDFGTVKDMQSDLMLTGVNELLGTPNYMAPEQFESARSATVRSDVYALAATLFAAVTGTVPFAGKTLLSILNRKVNQQLPSARALSPGINPRTERAILAALDPDPKLRPATCLGFLELLGATTWTTLLERPPDDFGPPPGSEDFVPELERRTSRRRRPRGRARYQPTDAPFGPPAMAILVNASLTGVQLVVQESFQLGESIDVELLTLEGLPALKRQATVRWVDTTAEGHYSRLGCAWEPALTPAELESFV